MARKDVNPDMDLMDKSVPNGSAPKKVGSSGGRVDINPDMDLSSGGTSEANTGGSIPESNRVAVNPNMDLSSEGASGEGTLPEQKAAVMPGVGSIPTGKKAANKSSQPE